MTRHKFTYFVLTLTSIFLIFTLTAPKPASAWQTPLVSIHPLMERAGQIDVPLNQALVLEGGESTNPKDYDPAFYGGDKRIFSGLVSLDPQLNLTPDIAETWDVSADGTVSVSYTHLRAH